MSAPHSQGNEMSLREAAQLALLHLQEMRDAWQRGVISTHDGSAARRSNRNVEAEVALRLALEAAPSETVTRNDVLEFLRQQYLTSKPACDVLDALEAYLKNADPQAPCESPPLDRDTAHLPENPASELVARRHASSKGGMATEAQPAESASRCVVVPLEELDKFYRALLSDPPHGPQKSIAGDDTIYHLDGQQMYYTINKVRDWISAATPKGGNDG